MRLRDRADNFCRCFGDGSPLLHVFTCKRELSCRSAFASSERREILARKINAFPFPARAGTLRTHRERFIYFHTSHVCVYIFLFIIFIPVSGNVRKQMIRAEGPRRGIFNYVNKRANKKIIPSIVRWNPPDAGRAKGISRRDNGDTCDEKRRRTQDVRVSYG